MARSLSYGIEGAAGGVVVMSLAIGAPMGWPYDLANPLSGPSRFTRKAEPEEKANAVVVTPTMIDGAFRSHSAVRIAQTPQRFPESLSC
jgi:hypothetical protein